MKLLFLFLFLFSIGFATKGIVLDTGSMRPTFQGGEIVDLIPANEAEVGEIVVFHDDNGVIMHRVWGKWYGCHITKGDGNIMIDLGCKRIMYKVEV